MEKPITLTVTYDEYITILCALQVYRTALLSEDLKSSTEQVIRTVQEQFLKQGAS